MQSEGMQVVPPWALGLLCLSKRLHSIYMLRLFNDCVAVLLAYAATALLLERCWRSAALMYSAAVSVKMSVLLMAPPVLVVMLKVPNPFCAIASVRWRLRRCTCLGLVHRAALPLKTSVLLMAPATLFVMTQVLVWCAPRCRIKSHLSRAMRRSKLPALHALAFKMTFLGMAWLRRPRCCRRLRERRCWA